MAVAEPQRLPHAFTGGKARGRPAKQPLGLLLLLAVVLAVAAPHRVGVGFVSRRSKGKVLLRYGDFEVYLHGRKKGQLIPKLQFRKTPPKTVAVSGLVASVEGDVPVGETQRGGKDFRGFPFTTHNEGGLEVSFPRVGGKVKMAAKDPPFSEANLDGRLADALELRYDQKIPGVGDTSLHLRSSGEWTANLSREVEDLGGHVHAMLNSQFDWSLDLNQTYPAWQSITPSVRYGATQDGISIHAILDVELARKALDARCQYMVQNIPGKYSPADLLHDCTLTLSPSGGRQMLQAAGSFNRKLPRLPVRGSLTYSARLRPVTLEASVDFDRYQLRAIMPRGRLAASLGRKGEGDEKLKELEVKLGKVSATAQMSPGKPRVRLQFGA